MPDYWDEDRQVFWTLDEGVVPAAHWLELGKHISSLVTKKENPDAPEDF